MRDLCVKCQEKPKAVNYYKEGRPFYRSICDTCARGSKKKKPRWSQLGYRKKDFCEKCGFKSNYPEQFNVYHIDGNLDNCRPANLKTICSNCQRILQKLGVRWRQGDLIPDF